MGGKSKNPSRKKQSAGHDGNRNGIGEVKNGLCRRGDAYDHGRSANRRSVAVSLASFAFST
jgi:hypothetical protein